jgi:thiol-disulfide isomerase/thioredoxin
MTHIFLLVFPHMAKQLKKFFKELAVLLLIIIITSIGVNLYKTRNAVTGPAPELSEISIKGKSLTLLNQKQPVLVHFWATWCPVCSLGHGTIDSIAKDYPVISIAMQSGNEQELLNFMSEKQLSYPVIEDDAGEIARQWNVRGVPASFIISPGGEIEFVEIGYSSEIGLRLRLWWANK